MSAKPQEAVVVAVVGSAGRNEDAHKVSKELFDAMLASLMACIRDKWKLNPKNIKLVSGGAAVADHIAVALVLKHPDFVHPSQLELYLPCKFDLAQGQAVANSTGKYMNALHRAFSQDIKHDTLQDLVAVKKAGAMLDDTSYPGFLTRNSAIAQRATHLFALTWGDSDERPTKSGGTLDTWNKCRKIAANRVHVRLDKLAGGSALALPGAINASSSVLGALFEKQKAQHKQKSEAN